MYIHVIPEYLKRSNFSCFIAGLIDESMWKICDTR